MPNPIFDSGPFRRDLPEARDFEKQLRLRFFELAEAKNIVGAAALDVTDIDTTGSPATVWANILNYGAKAGALQQLVTSIEQALGSEPQPKVRLAIKRVRDVDQAGGSLSPMRLLLANGRPFLDRTTLRGLLPELQNWNSDAAILTVRGSTDSGRTETQFLLGDRNANGMAYVNEELSRSSTMRHICRKAGMARDPPKARHE